MPSEAGPLEVRLTLALDSSDDARVLAEALGPEVGDDVPRTRTRLHRAGSVVTLHVAGDDVPALRAAVNAHLRWARTSLDVTRLARANPDEGDQP